MRKVWAPISQVLTYDEFFCIFPYYEKLMGKPMHFPYDEVCHRMESNGKKAPILWEKYEYQFPRLSHTMGFVAFSCTVGNLWGNPCTSHMMTSINFFLCELSDKFLAENNGHILFQKQLVVSYRIYV